MKKDKILVRINNLDELNNYKKLDISNFLFPLDKFSIGYPSFNLNDLKIVEGNVYLLINRVLDNEDINEFSKIIEDLSFVKGIIFEDIGIYHLLKDKNIPLIWNQNHFAVNSNSINFWLDKVTSVMISNELEKSELINVLNNVSNKVILPVFGLNMAMYSRRKLLSFFDEYKGFNLHNKAILKGNNVMFKALENDYGTVFFYNKYFNLINDLNLINDDKILLYYIDPNDININEIKTILDGSFKEYENRFFEKKTVYRIGDLDD